jgi:hypothetical protein
VCVGACVEAGAERIVLLTPVALPFLFPQIQCLTKGSCQVDAGPDAESTTSTTNTASDSGVGVGVELGLGVGVETGYVCTTAQH